MLRKWACRDCWYYGYPHAFKSAKNWSKSILNSFKTETGRQYRPEQFPHRNHAKVRWALRVVSSYWSQFVCIVMSACTTVSWYRRSWRKLLRRNRWIWMLNNDSKVRICCPVMNAALQNKSAVVVINEADSLSRDAQAALRRTMEKYMSNMRIILCANSTSKLIAPIKSRCLLMRVAAPNSDEVSLLTILFLSSILKVEGRCKHAYNTSRKRRNLTFHPTPRRR